VRWPLDQVMNLVPDARLVQIYLHVLGSDHRVASNAAVHFFALLARHADRQQAVTGVHARPGGCRARLDRLGNNALSTVDPGDPVPGRPLVTMTKSLRKIQ